MEKDCNKEIIEEVSKKFAEKVCSEEKGLAARATMGCKSRLLERMTKLEKVRDILLLVSSPRNEGV